MRMILKDSHYNDSHNDDKGNHDNDLIKWQ